MLWKKQMKTLNNIKKVMKQIYDDRKSETQRGGGGEGCCPILPFLNKPLNNAIINIIFQCNNKYHQ